VNRYVAIFLTVIFCALSVKAQPVQPKQKDESGVVLEKAKQFDRFLEEKNYDALWNFLAPNLKEDYENKEGYIERTKIFSQYTEVFFSNQKLVLMKKRYAILEGIYSITHTNTKESFKGCIRNVWVKASDDIWYFLTGGFRCDYPTEKIVEELGLERR